MSTADQYFSGDACSLSIHCALKVFISTEEYKCVQLETVVQGLNDFVKMKVGGVPANGALEQ